MLDYNTIFFAECQDRNGFLFHFVNFTQTWVIFYSRLTSKSIPFLLYMCSCFQLLADTLSANAVGGGEHF